MIKDKKRSNNNNNKTILGAAQTILFEDGSRRDANTTNRPYKAA